MDVQAINIDLMKSALVLVHLAHIIKMDFVLSYVLQDFITGMEVAINLALQIFAHQTPALWFAL